METNQQPRNYRGIITLFLILLIGIFVIVPLIKDIRGANDKKFQETKIELKTWKDKEGLSNAKANALSGELKDIKTLVKSKDATIARLARQVNKNTLSVGSHEVVTENSVSGKTEIDIQDSLKSVYERQRGDTCNPVYKTHVKDQWQDVTVRAGRDSINVKYTIYNAFDYKIEKSKDSTFVSVKNLNPHTDTKSLKFLVAQEKKVSKWKWFAGGAGTAMLIKLVVDFVRK